MEEVSGLECPASLDLVQHLTVHADRGSSMTSEPVASLLASVV